MQRGYFVEVPGGNTSFARAELSGLTMENKLCSLTFLGNSNLLFSERTSTSIVTALWKLHLPYAIIFQFVPPFLPCSVFELF